MNWKILSAFATGAVLASGFVYMAVKPLPTRKPRLTLAEVQTPFLPPVQTPAAQPAPAVEAAAQSAPATGQVAPPAPVPAHEKPSPMPPPLRKAPATAVPSQDESRPAPAPLPPAMTEPINKDRPYNDAKPAGSYPPPEATQTDAPQPEPPPPPPPPISATLPDERRQPAPSWQAGRAPNRVILLAGTVLPVRIGETISAAHNQKGDTFLATLDQPLVIDGFIIAERGARVEGRVVESQAPTQGKGASRLEIQLVKLSTADGQYVKIRTEPFRKEGASNGGKDVATVAAGAAIGAAIGGAAGSGKGAAIGAAAGGAAGVADVLLTRGRPAEIPVETRIGFRMAEAVTITERLN